MLLLAEKSSLLVACNNFQIVSGLATHCYCLTVGPFGTLPQNSFTGEVKKEFYLASILFLLQLPKQFDTIVSICGKDKAKAVKNPPK
jgi:hypothetical protein